MKRLRDLLNRRRAERELDAELDFHFEEQVRGYIASGMTEEQARREARLNFGGLDHIKEDCRDERRFAWLDAAAQDARYALRTMRKNWPFAAAVVLLLAVGIGANTAIFTLVDALMLRNLPVKDPQNLLLVAHTENGRHLTGFTYEQFRAMHDANGMADLAAYAPVRLNISVDGVLEPASEGQLVSGNYFSLLGVNAIAGRGISPDDDRVPRGHPVAVLSHGYWTRRFGADPSAVGRVISLSGTPFTVIGIAPRDFFGVEVGSAPDVFLPIMMQPVVMPVAESLLENPQVYSTWLQAIARLKPGVQAPQAAAALLPRYRQYVPPPKFGGAPPQMAIVFDSASTGVSELRRQFSQPLLVLMALVAVVLLVACANTANLLLARAAARQGEFALRMAIGAGRWRVVRQLLTESLMLAALGGVGALLLARWGTRLLILYISSGRNPVVVDLSPNLRVFVFTAAAALGAAILFGLAPALSAARMDLTPALRNLRGAKGGFRAGPRTVLAVAQVALSIVLLAGCGLFVRSLQNLNGQESDTERDRLLIVRVEPKGSDQRGRVIHQLDRTYNDLLERVRNIPGVRRASMGNVSPLKPNSGCCGLRDRESGEIRLVSQVMVYPDYFETMAIPLVAGRNFEDADFRANAPRVSIINETFARTRFAGQNPIDQMINDNRVIGVAKDSRYTNLKGVAEPMFYTPFLAASTGRGQMILHARLSAASDAVINRVREEVWKADPAVPQFDVHTLEDEVNAVLVQDRLIALLSTFFGGIALLLSATGLYGLLAFGVFQRTGEIGMRIALGAARGNVVWMILRDALWIVGIGIAVGVPAAVGAAYFASTRIETLLFGLKPTDPATLGLACLALVVVGISAASLPARRASRVDPVVALRQL